GQQESNWPTF
nr:immunoglobulin light chain junction region [Macaca mulatta]MPN95637.1 immunoglobulin light chain junction region [Macaca mulatta]